MKAFLLAAGKGTRLRPLTDTVPKCLAPIGGIPLLGIWLEHCRMHNVTDVLVNAHHLADQVRNYLERGDFGVRVTLVQEGRLLGTAGTVAANRSFVAEEDAFFILYADNVTNADLTGMARFHASHGACLTMGLFRTDRPSQSGIVAIDRDGVVTAFEEKPAHSVSDLANAGVYVAGPELFEHLPPTVPADFGFDVLPGLVGAMRGYLIEGSVVDIGTPESYARANREWRATWSAST